MKVFSNFLVITLLIVHFSCGRSSDEQASNELREMSDEEVAPSAPLSKASRAASAKSAAAARAAKAAARTSKDIEDVLGQLGGIGSGGALGGSVIKAVHQIRTRMVIRTAELEFEVEKYDESTAQLLKLVDGWEGFITSSTTEIPFENVKTGTWILRVPSEKFETALEQIKKLTKKLEKESLEGQDVTEEFYDLEARMQNKLLEEKQVQDILRRTGTIRDVLEVQRELSNIREEIERFEGRKKYLADQTGLSTITVRLHEPYPMPVSSSGGFWATIGSGFSEGFRGFARVLSGTITFIIAGIPVFALIIGLVWLLLRLFRRMRAKKQTA